MSSDIPDLPFAEPLPGADATAFAKASQELKARVAAVGARFRCRDAEVLDEDGLILEVPNGREFRVVYFWDSVQINRLLATNFEEYTYLGDYDAVASYSAGTIEAGLRVLDARSSRAILPALTGHLAEEDVDTFEVPGGPAGVHLYIGPPTETFQALNGARRGPTHTLRISGAAVSQHDDAVALLERLAGALLFQVDLVAGIPIWLARRRNLRYGPRSPRPSSDVTVEFPRSEYDSAPLSLYWYGRGATGMPLLQFLAFYQVIEFYFPVHSRAEVQRRVQQLLKDPAFRVDRDADIARLLNAVAASSSGGFGDERAQLQACLRECVAAPDLSHFLTATPQRKKFFSSKHAGLTSRSLNLDKPGADLRNDVAERIYDIRCKIVHTKASQRDGDFELLLPFSKEAELLYDDIALLGFLAGQVLIASSSPLRLPTGT